MGFTVLAVDDQRKRCQRYDVFVSEDGGPYILQSLDVQWVNSFSEEHQKLLSATVVRQCQQQYRGQRMMSLFTTQR